MKSLRVAVGGAGKVGRSIAAELIAHGHEVLLIERDPRAIKPASQPGAQWYEGDACEMAVLEGADLQSYDVLVAATGDDKVNLVLALLAKTEYGVARVVARVNHPKNEWLFNSSWGVDVSVSSPRMLTALVEEAVTVGDLVPLMRFVHGDAALTELTLPADSPLIGRPLASLDLPEDAALVAVLREGRVQLPSPDVPMEAGDELLFVTSTAAVEAQLARTLKGP